MFVSDTNKGFSLKAYQGTQMTLLAMNMKNNPTGKKFAGFTLGYTNPKGQKNSIQNFINFTGKDGVTPSELAPIQLFKWVHFPGSYQQTGALTGKYTYEATPRYLDDNGTLLPLDNERTARVKVDVEDFHDGYVRIGFTRAFLKSQAFAKRYGAKQKLYPNGDWIFDPNQQAGVNKKYGPYTYEDMYAWLGFNARTMVYEMLSEALKNKAVTVDMFAYDFNDPVIADMCLKLARAGRIRMILDDATLHKAKVGKEPTKEDDFAQRFIDNAKGNAEIFRCNFARYSHCKIIILRNNGKAYKVLTGSTNFAFNGLYVNANHVIIFEDKSIAQYYGDVFTACWKNGSAPAFRKTAFSNTAKTFKSNKVPSMTVNFSPHTPEYAKELLDSITAQVTSDKTRSVLFAIMDMGKNSTGSLIPAIRTLHQDDSIYTYGVTDNSSKDVSLYKPGKKHGLLINAKSQRKDLPPQFREEHTLPGHAIHHKFIVLNFNQSSGCVYCGSSNLALGGEKDNGDNLICIKDTDVATVFAIEALRLTDHFNLAAKQEKAAKTEKPLTLDSTGKWVKKFYNKEDIRYVERKVFA